MKRRGFLGGIAAALTTTPEKVLRASGVNPTVLGSPTEVNTRFGAAVQIENPTPLSSWNLTERIRLLALKAAAPWWLEKQRRARAKHVRYLEPHIACLVSVSPAMKINMQREFQYRTQFELELERNELSIAEEQFKI